MLGKYEINQYGNIREMVEEEKKNEYSFYTGAKDWESPFSDFSKRNITIDDFAPSGLSQAGLKFDFPANFLYKLKEQSTDSTLADTVLCDRISTYYGSHSEDNNTFIREFYGKIYAVLSSRYAVFDDDEVMDILKDSSYLMDSQEIWTDISPERFHMRFISKNKLTINGDDSPLSMAVFVDNSMTGQSAFKIRFGLYRWACTNGMISNLKDFTLIKERHLGEKQFSVMLSEELENVPLYEKMLFDMAENMNETKSSIYDMTDEEAVRYIKEKLNCGKKVADNIIELYNGYGGITKWDLCNAITDYAHELSTDRRIFFEEKALKVA